MAQCVNDSMNQSRSENTRRCWSVTTLGLGVSLGCQPTSIGFLVEEWRMTSKCSIQEFIRELRSLSRAQFTLEGVHEFLKKHPIDPSSLEKYLFFRKSHYTRNLIDESDLYEVLSI